MEKGLALLIIDIQVGAFPADVPCFDAKGVVNRINTLSDKFRQARLPVIVVQHDGTLQNEFVPGTLDWELIPELLVTPDDIRVVKNAHDVFYGTDLGEILNRRGIDTLVITGSATEFCIESSIQSALSKDYKVIVVRDGHTTLDRPPIGAAKIIEHYNEVWANLIPTKGKVVVRRADEIEVS